MLQYTIAFYRVCVACCVQCQYAHTEEEQRAAIQARDAADPAIL